MCFPKTQPDDAFTKQQIRVICIRDKITSRDSRYAAADSDLDLSRRMKREEGKGKNESAA